jgi:hypothetical protein
MYHAPGDAGDGSDHLLFASTGPMVLAIIGTDSSPRHPVHLS